MNLLRFRRSRPLLSAIAFCMAAFSGCTAPSAERGLITTQGRGAVELSKHGDPLLETGDSARKVTPDFAKGYAKADIDNAHREYFARLRAVTGTDHSEDEGRQTLVDMTLPERTDSTGIVRAPRPVVVSVTE